ncbi:unnamed protein product, partial [Musa textilis]
GRISASLRYGGSGLSLGFAAAHGGLRREQVVSAGGRAIGSGAAAVGRLLLLQLPALRERRRCCPLRYALLVQFVVGAVDDIDLCPRSLDNQIEPTQNHCSCRVKNKLKMRWPTDSRHKLETKPMSFWLMYMTGKSS